MVESIVRNTEELLPVCAWVTGQYGIHDVYVGVPVRLSRSGRLGDRRARLNAEELIALRAAAEGIARQVRGRGEAVGQVAVGRLGPGPAGGASLIRPASLAS